MAVTNRDEFSARVKKIAAQRTGYRCSLCSISTIGPSHKSSVSTACIGEAAHICAAAPKGARYDPFMTPEERASVDNCIWMCKIHARVIDVDEAKYTVDYLRELKIKAEKYAEDAISDVDIFRNTYNTLGEDVSSLNAHFLQMIQEGNFDLLRNILENYTNTISSTYDELVLRYKIIYDIYCNRIALNEHINEYLKLPIHTGVKQILEYAISFGVVDVVSKLIDLSEDEKITQIGNMLVNGTLESSLIGKPEVSDTFQIDKEQYNVINHYIIHRAIAQNMYRLKTVDGNEYPLTPDETYYKLLYAAYKLVGKIVYNDSSFMKHPEDSDYWELNKNQHIITQLDIVLQDFLWEALLHFYFEDEKQFNDLIDVVPICVRNMPRISKILWLYRIRYKISDININDILNYSVNTENYLLLSRYLWLLSENERISFLKDHLYLCRKSCRFLQMMLEYDKKNNTSFVSFTEYESLYENDFLYRCLKYSIIDDVEEKTSIVKWLSTHMDLLLVEDLYLYLNILYSEGKWDEILEISTRCIHNEHLFYIANLLTKNKEETFLKKGCQIYEMLIEKGWQNQGLFYNLAVVYHQTGRIEKAKRCFLQEYDQFGTVEALYHLLRLRIETNDVQEDDYLNKASDIVTKDFQQIVAASYDKLNNYVNAKKYVLRSLLIDDSAECIGALFYLNIEGEEDTKDPEYVQNECVCTLESESKTINIAIHSRSILKGINPNSFANCIHYSEDSSPVAALMYLKKEATLVFEGEQYRLVDIKPSSAYFSSYALQQVIIRNKGIQTISAGSSEEFIANITKCLSETQAKTDSILNSYNLSEIRYPISVFSSIFGKDSIESCEFIAHGNSEKTRNNVSYVDVDQQTTFILSLDAIVNLIVAGVDVNQFKNAHMLCPSQVKKRLLNDISKSISNLNSKAAQGSMLLIDEKAHFFERTLEIKRDRYLFLCKIKNFVESLPEIEGFDFETTKEGMDSLFSEGKMEIEAGSLALLQNYKNAILVTDDQFLYSVAAMLGYSSMGLCGFLAAFVKDSLTLIEISKQLKAINFNNYMPWFLFDKIVDSLDSINSPDDCNSAANLLTNWLISDRGGEDASDHHRELIIQLYRDYVNYLGHPLPEDHPLIRIAVSHFAQLHPDYVQKVLEDLFKNVSISFED